MLLFPDEMQMQNVIPRTHLIEKAALMPESCFTWVPGKQIAFSITAALATAALITELVAGGDECLKCFPIPSTFLSPLPPVDLCL